MQVARSASEARAAVAAARGRGAAIGLVPTMGYLHRGHLSLAEVARSEGASYVVVSIFVNPAQFGPNEDFEKYPRDEAADTALLEQHGVDLLFAPTVDEMYPPGAATRVHVERVAAPLEGERRPGHFDGVATIVLKLFNIVTPDVAVFGEKDAQQCAVVRQLVRDLDIPVRLAFGPIVREGDGLAMSSRNAYLTAAERELAPALARSLESGRREIEKGAGHRNEVERAMERELARWPGVRLDYLRVVDPATFEPPADLRRELLLVGAVFVGRTRLIDNIRIPAPERETPSRPEAAPRSVSR